MRPIFRPRNSVVRECRLAVACMLLILLSSACVASSIVGRVMNRSRNQPSGGDEVILYSVDHTMVEMARAKSSHDGTFRFDTSGNFSYLIAVFHQKVSYHSKTLRGSGPVEIPVYDSAQKLAGVLNESNTFFLQPTAEAVNVTEFFVISNRSNPPRTVAGTKTFDFQLPEGAVLDSAAIQPPGTLPLRVSASACGLKNQYCIAYPIRPGTSRVRAVYHLTQPASAWITLPQQHAAKNAALMIPESSQLETRTAGVLENRGTQNGLAMYVTTKTLAGESLVFRFPSSVSRTGTRAPETASLGFTSLPSAIAQTPTSQPAPSSIPSQLSTVLVKKVLIAFLASMALMAMIAVGGNLCAHRFCVRGKQS